MTATQTDQCKALGLKKRLSIRLWSLFALFLVLDLGSYVLVQRAVREREFSDRLILSVFDLRGLAKDFTVHTGLAVIGLATSDFEKVIENRLECQKISADVKQALRTLLDGGVLQVDHEAIKVDREDLKEVRPQLLKIEDDWQELDRTATLVLRFEKEALRKNPRVEDTQIASSELFRSLSGLIGSLRGETQRRMEKLRRQQILISLGTSLLILITALYTFTGILTPMDKAIQLLEKAKKQLYENEALFEHHARLVALGEMAAGIAHEVNNPVTAIKGNVDMTMRLAREHKLSLDRALRSLKVIGETSMRISNIVNGLRMLSRQDESPDFEVVPVKKVFDETLILCRQRFMESGISLRVSDISPELFIECHPVQVSQVLLNLLSNAFDAVSVLKDYEERWVALNAKEEGHDVVIEVTDGGNRIPSELADKIMTPFFTTKGPHGTGIGLSISKRIAEGHRGSLTLDRSAIHTRFSLRLPHLH